MRGRRCYAVSLVALALLAAAPAGTALAAPPSASAEAATEVGYTTARAHGLVAPGGPEAFYRFEYIAETLVDQNLAEGRDPFAGATADGMGWVPTGFGATAVAPLLGEFGGLEAGVEYRLRLVAENAEGAAVALAPSFSTAKPLEPIPCFGDNCQVLPPEPREPVLATAVPGVGNPKVHYTRYGAKPKKPAKKKAKKHRGKKHGKGEAGKGGSPNKGSR